MKKAFALLLLLSILLVTLSSCNLFWMDKHPANQEMTKWEGDGLELYIGQLGQDRLLINRGSEKWVFDVTWHGNGLAIMGLADTRRPTVPEDMRFAPEHIFVAGYIVSLRPNGTALLTYQGDASYYKGLFPEKAKLRKTAENLTIEDFPLVDNKENDSYRFCPIYHFGTNWISDDGNVRISMFDSNNIRTTFSGEEDWLYSEFIELDSMFYAGERKKDLPYNLPLSAMQEHWQCEYFEDYFIATVIQSERYETGETITFRKEISPTKSETDIQGGN